MAAWAADELEGRDRGLAERARARVRHTALYGPSRYRDAAEELAAERAPAERRAERRSDLRQALLEIDPAAVRLLEAQHEPELIHHEDGQVGASEEDRSARDAVLPGEARHERLRDRAA